MNYNTKPQRVTAIQFTGENSHEIERAIGHKVLSNMFTEEILVKGQPPIVLFNHDWVVKYETGEIRTFDPSFFGKIFERI